MDFSKMNGDELKQYLAEQGKNVRVERRADGSYMAYITVTSDYASNPEGAPSPREALQSLAEHLANRGGHWTKVA